MDVYERRVFRRKRPILADTLGFSIADQKRYMKLGLLNDGMMAEIMVEQTEFGQMFKFLDLLSTREGGLEMFLQILDEKDMQWMIDEIKAEICAEKGELEVEEYVYREAGMVVHRQFGDTTRVPESDKKEIQLLLALRYQTAKQAWQKHLLDTKIELEKALQWKTEECHRMKLTTEKVNAFLRIQEKHINELAHDMHNAPELLKEEEKDDFDIKKTDYLTLFESMADRLLDVLARIIFEREHLTKERKRCLEVLNMNRPALELDTILNYALSSSAQDATLAKREADLSNKLAQSLDSRMKTMRIETDREASTRERQMAQLNMLLRDKATQVNILEKQLSEMRQKWEDSREDVIKWKKRCELLEKTRRLGYYTPGWYDKLYEIEDIEYGRAMETPPPLVQTSRSAHQKPPVSKFIKRNRPSSAVVNSTKKLTVKRKPPSSTSIKIRRNSASYKGDSGEGKQPVITKLSYDSSNNS